jgi:hypothetical protein
MKNLLLLLSIILSAISAKSYPSAVKTIAGEAVFRARVLDAMHGSLAHYDDLVLCNSQGLYKGGKSKLQAQLDEMQAVLRQNELQRNAILVYPNPASTELNVDYKLVDTEVAEFSMYDLLGKQLNIIAIKANTQTAKFSLSGFAQGVYTYKFKSSMGQLFTGKILVE